MTVLRYKESLLNTRLDAITTAIGSNGKLKIYAGTIPTNVDTALGGQTLLASLALSATAAGAAASHVLTFSAITNDSSADGTGTAAWGTVTTSGDVRIIDFDVGTSATSMIIDNTSINAGQVVGCSAFGITAGNYT